MEIAAIALVASAILGYALFSKKLDGTWLTMPMVFAAFGLGLGSAGWGLEGWSLDVPVIGLV